MIPASARNQFSPAGVYLNTATMGLPPRRAFDAVASSLERWRTGTTDAPAYDEHIERARAGFARLAGVDVEDVAIGPQVSVFAGLIAASLPRETEILVAEGDFTSVTFPFWARGLRVREAPLRDLAAQVTPGTGLVAVSLVQSADGSVLDLEALKSAAMAAGARILLDVTQAAGWLPLQLDDVDYVVCGGYKFLLAPRGTAFLAVRRELRDQGPALHAGWYAGTDPWQSIYGSPLRLAPSAKRFDVSPAWSCWVGQAESLDLLTSLDPSVIHEHTTRLAAELAGVLGLPDPSSAIMSIPVRSETAEALRRADVAASMRAGRLRLSFHLYSDREDVARVAEVLDGLVER